MTAPITFPVGKGVASHVRKAHPGRRAGRPGRMNPFAQRRVSRTVPTSIVGGLPREFACHYCPAVFTDAEAGFAHLFTHPESDRRRGERRTAERRVADRRAA